MFIVLQLQTVIFAEPPTVLTTNFVLIIGTLKSHYIEVLYFSEKSQLKFYSLMCK